MWYINGKPSAARYVIWTYNEVFIPDEEDEGLRVSIDLSSSDLPQRRPSIKKIEKILKESPVKWINVGRKEWALDLEKLKEEFPQLSQMAWFKGDVLLEPEFEIKERAFLGKTRYDWSLAFYIFPEELNEECTILPEPPIIIKESLEHFKKDFPDPYNVAFIMMKFGETKAHEEIVNAIKAVLNSNGITGIRADDKHYHDDLFPNIMTYLYGCGIGIAVFERIEAEEFNPNVSLEVGYMFALNKPVCLLKDKTLKTLHTDLVGKLYKSFDPQDPNKTISNALSQWLLDKEII